MPIRVCLKLWCINLYLLFNSYKSINTFITRVTNTPHSRMTNKTGHYCLALLMCAGPIFQETRQIIPNRLEDRKVRRFLAFRPGAPNRRPGRLYFTLSLNGDAPIFGKNSMQKTAFCIFYFFIFTACGFSQFFYQDIITAANSKNNFQLLKANKVKKVTATSIEPDGSETENFGITQIVTPSKNELTTITSSGMTGTSTLITSFNANDLPVKITDSSLNTINTVTYHYNENGKLLLVSSHSYEPGDTNHYSVREDHHFYYNESGSLVKMLKVIDLTDTLTVVFNPLENGMPGEEQWFKNKTKTENWFYYYDNKNRLTDIVRYNAVAKKLLPDYIFSYDENGRLEQQTVVLPGTNFYRLWLYDYANNGLKKSETVFKKGKEQEGRIIYEYE